MKKIEALEPWFFLFFGVFHLHRIWALLDRKAYADFWLGILNSKVAPYYLTMGILAALCLLGIRTFLKNRRRNYWWRWVYVFGGGYLLFDLFAIAADVPLWHELILKMYDTSSPYWTVLWLLFILMGGASFALGVSLLVRCRKYSRQPGKNPVK